MFKVLFEGPDRVGKSTLLRACYDFFESNGVHIKMIHTNSLGLKPRNSKRYLKQLSTTLVNFEASLVKEKPDIVFYDRGVLSDIIYWIHRNKSERTADSLCQYLPFLLRYYYKINFIVVVLPIFEQHKEELFTRFHREKPFFKQRFDGAYYLSKGGRHSPSKIQQIYEDYLFFIDVLTERGNQSGHLMAKLIVTNLITKKTLSEIKQEVLEGILKFYEQYRRFNYGRTSFQSFDE